MYLSSTNVLLVNSSHIVILTRTDASIRKLKAFRVQGTMSLLGVSMEWRHGTLNPHSIIACIFLSIPSLRANKQQTMPFSTSEPSDERTHIINTVKV